ncbi:MAG: GXWXG domain-containing protein [Polyangiaceae bacterium]
MSAEERNVNTGDRFKELAESAENVAIEELFAFFDSLPPVATESMIGDWDGGVFRTGHPGEQQLGALRWVGKTFHSASDVDPIIRRGKDGGRQVSPVLGKATLQMRSHRGVSTAAMVYTDHPVVDYFREIESGVVLGVMDRQGDEFPLFFFLRRLPVAAL